MSDLFEQPQLHLANPQKDYIGLLRGVKEFESKSYLNNIKEISFKIYEYENGKRNEYYDDLDDVQLIEVFVLDWYQIKEVNETHGEDIPVSYKEIVCKSLEDELISKKVYNLDGVFSIYNPSDTSKSIMHIVTNEISWNIGRIPTSLLSVYRVLSIDSAYIYSLLTGDISKSFGDCIFQFDTYSKLINCYTLEELGELTDITINDSNLLKSWNKSSDKDRIVTKMRILGGVGTDGIQFDIREINYGSDTIANYDYFKPRMSFALRTALENQQNAYNTYTSQFTTTLNTLKQYNVDLNTLNNQLKEIESQISAQEQVTGSSVTAHKGRPPIEGETDYAIYQSAVAQIDILNPQKLTKKAEISSKNAQITAIQNTLDIISGSVAPSNFFTSELLDELDCFTFQNDDYVDDTFIASSELTKDQIIDMKLQLLDNGNKELLKVCRPQSELKTTLKNLWSIRDEKDCLISYKVWRQQFKLGNLVTIMPTDDFWTTVRIIGIEINYDNPDDSEVIFSSRTRLDDSVYLMAELQSQASRSYSAIQMNKYAYKEAASNTASFLAFQNGIFNATLNKVVNSDNEDIYIDKFGLHGRRLDVATNTYNKNQMWLNSNVMMFSSDSFKTADSAFGRLTLGDGTEVMGINTKYLIGKILITENTYIENESGNYSFDKNGFLATATSSVNTYSVGINPSTPAEIFNIKVNGATQLGIDTLNNRLNYSGAMSVTNGTNTVNINPSTGIELLKGSTKQFYIDENGNAVFSGDIKGSTIYTLFEVNDKEIAVSMLSGLLKIDLFNSSNQITNTSNLQYDGLSCDNFIGNKRARYNTNGISIGTLTTDNFIVESNGDVNCSMITCLSISSGYAYVNNSTVLTEANYILNNRKYPPELHDNMHDSRYQPIGSYASQSDLNSLEGRVAAIEAKLV